MERLLRSLKPQWLPTFGYKSLVPSKADITDYFIRHYYRRRPHGANDCMPPHAAEHQFSAVSKIV